MRKANTKKTRAKTKRKAGDIRRKRLPRHHAIALREAGHAVAAWERGVMLMPLSIFAVAKGARRNVWNDPVRNVDFEWVRTTRSPALARRLAEILIAGPVAEGAFGPKLPRATASLERLRDAKALLVASARPSAGDSKKHFARAVADSEKFLARPRVKQAVAALAAVLLSRGTVRGGEAAAIIETHLDV